MKPFAKIDIRSATADDLTQMTHIWQTVFGDSDAYIRFFFENRCALSDALCFDQLAVVLEPFDALIHFTLNFLQRSLHFLLGGDIM